MLTPSQLWMCCPEYAQGKEEKDDIEDENVSIGEDLGGNGDSHISWVGCPHDPQDVCGDSRHAKYA